MVGRDYTDEDVGNILSLEHINLHIPSQEIAILFYVVGLGLTRQSLEAREANEALAELRSTQPAHPVPRLALRDGHQLRIETDLKGGGGALDAGGLDDERERCAARCGCRRRCRPPLRSTRLLPRQVEA